MVSVRQPSEGVECYEIGKAVKDGWNKLGRQKVERIRSRSEIRRELEGLNPSPEAERVLHLDRLHHELHCGACKRDLVLQQVAAMHVLGDRCHLGGNFDS